MLKIIKDDIKNSNKVLNIEETEKIYLELKKYTCVDEIVKKAHIYNIKSKV